MTAMIVTCTRQAHAPPLVQASPPDPMVLNASSQSCRTTKPSGEQALAGFVATVPQSNMYDTYTYLHIFIYIFTYIYMIMYTSGEQTVSSVPLCHSISCISIMNYSVQL